MKKLLLLLLLLPSVVSAQGITVPQGGTGTTTFQVGTIPFGASALRLTSDNNLFWNNTLKFLGIGTSSPYARLSVVGQVVASYFTATTTTASTFPSASTTALTVAGVASTSVLRIDTLADGCLNIVGGLVGSQACGGGSGSDPFTHPSAGISATTTLMQLFGGASTTLFSANQAQIGGTATTTITNDGKVGIASSSPWARLSVDGEVAFQGTDFATTTIGNHSTYLKVEKQTFAGVIDVPVLRGVSSFGTAALASADIFYVFNDTADPQIGLLNKTTLNSAGLQYNTTDDRLDFVNATGGYFFNGGRVGIGSSTPGATLSVAGNGLFNGILHSLNEIRGDFFSATSTTASSTFQGVEATRFGGTTATSSLAGLNLLTGGLTIDTLRSALLKTNATGGVIGAVAGTDYENPLTFNSPLSRSVNAVSFLFNTVNTWTGLNSFAANASTTQLSAFQKIFIGGTGTTTLTGDTATSTFSGDILARGISAWEYLNVPFINATSTASSTLAGPIDASGFCVKGTTNCLSNVKYLSVPFAATSTWSGTTTKYALTVPYGLTLNSGMCYTNAGTLGIQVQDQAGNKANYIPTASTTPDNFVYSTGNTFTTGEQIVVLAGTPASSPTIGNCTFKLTPN